jgi:iron complex outermembrane receptor protein
VLSYDVDDRLGNFAPITRPDDAFIVGFRRSALGTAWGPRTSVEVSPLYWLSFLAAYGEGYRSPQARVLDDGEDAPFSKVRSMDAGVRFDWEDPFELTVGGYYTHLSDDVAFDADEGRLERIGQTQRLGGAARAESRPVDWIVGALSFTYVHATLLEPPPPTPEEPQPPFEKGQNLPFVPPVVVRADLGARPTLAERVGRFPLVGRAGVGFSFLSARPLPYGEYSDPVHLLDAGVGLDWGPLALGFEVFNVLDIEYAAVEYNFASSWDPTAARSRVPARHLAAGAPRSWMLTLGARL